MQKIAFHLPLNDLSFGQTSLMLLRNLYEREAMGSNEYDIYICPIGPVDVNSQKTTPEFRNWLQKNIIKYYESYTRDIPVFKLWHLNGSLESLSTKTQSLLSFYELDNPTKFELNVAKNNRLLLSSKYAVNVFKMFGANAEYLPLAFDEYNFKKLDKKFHVDGRVVFNLCGKFERRKQHAKVIQAWIKKFGNNPKFFLQCATYNVHLNEQQNNDLIKQVVGNNKPFNVNFFPRMPENATYNDFLNSANIIIGMSGGEGQDLPILQSIAMGKHAVTLNAHVYKDYCNKDNSILIDPSGKVSAVDNLFFRPNDMWNTGNIFDWNSDEFIAGCERAIQRVQANPVNEKGLELAKEYSVNRFADSVLKYTLE